MHLNELAWCTLVCYILISTFTTVYSKKYVEQLNRRLLQTYVTGHLKVTSKLQCVSVCMSTPLCLTASWSASQHECLLSDVEVATKWTLGGPHKYLESASEWETYGEIRYSITNIVGENGRYTLTFAEAQAVCALFNTTLASRSQLLAARGMGFELCQCGWMSDQKNGFVLQAFNSTCWGSFNEQINYCNYGRASAYCVLK